MNIKESIVKLHEQIIAGGRSAPELDLVMMDADVPTWSMILNVSLLSKLKKALEKTKKRAENDYQRVLMDLEEL